ncbi:MAG: low-specificity L-threonine aldolase [Anaerolineae bacterium]|nr:low-specificity L-threonine aldolase [Thermoflexales bacterium]MDW8395970.1 low-specificity L-threonine aldolase [Anaerolineae bacterium]
MAINGYIDLRSDTFTLPTPAMREAMATAEVGDDVFGEDPTVNRLQQMAAERLGFEDALLVCSGTMGNLVALLTHCGRGDEIIVGDQAHIHIYEGGNSAVIGAIHSRVLPNQPDGTLSLDDIRQAIRPRDVHFPETRVVCLENTHNRMGGTALTPEYTRQVVALAQEHGLRVHIDGARIFNAAVALGVDVKALVAGADSVTFCLSKGLSAPVGSVLCGSRAFIQLARRRRKVLGGGLRQAGVIAAAGIVALEQMVDRLCEDHANARLLAEHLTGVPGICVEQPPLPTNMVYFRLMPELPFDAPEFCRRAEAERVRMLPEGSRRIRAVTHCWVTRDEVITAAQVIAHVVHAA